MSVAHFVLQIADFGVGHFKQKLDWWRACQVQIGAVRGQDFRCVGQLFDSYQGFVECFGRHGGAVPAGGVLGHCQGLLIGVSIIIVDTCAHIRRQQKLWIMTPAQARAARAILGMTQGALVKMAGVSLSTVVDFEKERRVVAEPSVTAIREALEATGVEFIAENGGGAGVRLRRKE